MEPFFGPMLEPNKDRHYGLQLYKAVERDHKDELKNLLQSVSEDAEAQVFLDMALQRAVILGRDACAQLLLSHGADSRSKEKAMNEKILAAARQAISTSLLVAWIQHCDSIQRCPANRGETRMDGNKFREAILEMDGEQELLPPELRARIERMSVSDCNKTLELLCEDHENTKTVGDTPLILAAEAGHVSIMDRLLKAGADVDDVGTEGRTALHAAALNSQSGAVELLLSHGARMNTKDSDGATPMSYACLKMDSSTLGLLVRHLSQCDVNIQDKYGETILFDVLRGRHDHFQCLNHLINKGLDVDHRNRDGFTALYLAVREGKPRVVYLMLKANCDVNLTGKYFCRLTNRQETLSPFQASVVDGQMVIARMLRETGCDVSVPWDMVEAARKSGRITHGDRLWLEQFRKHPLSLREAARKTIRSHIGSRSFAQRVRLLPLPEQMKQEVLIPELESLLEECPQMSRSHWGKCLFSIG